MTDELLAADVDDGLALDSEELELVLIDPEETRHVPRILSECGVRLVIVEGLPNGKIDGVCTWLDKNSPVIGLSLPQFEPAVWLGTPPSG